MSGTDSTFWPDEPESTPNTPRSSGRGRSPDDTRLTASAKSPTAASPATATTTTTDAPWTCAICADLITSVGISDEPENSLLANYPRFLLIPKAARAEREPVFGGLEEVAWKPPNAPNNPDYVYSDGAHRTQNKRKNVHPTVKPVDLMRHLVRLVTPQTVTLPDGSVTAGTVLDPFAGSGSTLIAAENEGFNWLGIEREESYVAIAEARLMGTQRGLGLDVPAPTPTAPTGKGHWPKERGPSGYQGGWAGQTELPERYEKDDVA